MMEKIKIKYKHKKKTVKSSAMYSIAQCNLCIEKYFVCPHCFPMTEWKNASSKT